MKKRIFVAIKASSEIEDDFLMWKEKFSNIPVRWIEPRNLHITVLAPWYEEGLEDARAALGQIAGALKSFELHFTKIAYGPHPKRARLIWAEGGAPTQLLVLKDAVERAFQRISEPRTTRLHITLARFCEQDFPRFKIKHLDEKINWRQRVQSISLMESKLLRSGAQYSVIDEVKL